MLYSHCSIKTASTWLGKLGIPVAHSCSASSACELDHYMNPVACLQTQALLSWRYSRKHHVRRHDNIQNIVPFMSTTCLNKAKAGLTENLRQTETYINTNTALVQTFIFAPFPSVYHLIFFPKCPIRLPYA